MDHLCTKFNVNIKHRYWWNKGMKTGETETHMKQSIEAVLVVEPLLQQLRKVTLQLDHDDFCANIDQRYSEQETNNTLSGFPTKPAIPHAIQRLKYQGQFSQPRLWWIQPQAVLSPRSTGVPQFDR
jgi:hypothetical protein